MASNTKHPDESISYAGSGPALRQQAEAQLRRQEALRPEPFELLSAEASRQTLHDLRVYQIELEMQNEELRQSQVALAVERERYFDLYDLAPVGYCTISEQGLVQQANLTAATLLCMSRSALANQPINRFIVKADQDIYYLCRQRLLATGKPQSVELSMLKGDGHTFQARLEATLAHDDAGAPLLRITLTDVTESRQAEAALRESEDRYRTLFDLGPVAVYSCDTAGHIQKYNLRAVELWGREPVPGDAGDRFCGSFKLLRPDGSVLPHDQCPMAEVARGRMAQARDMEVAIERPDGSVVAVIVNIRPLKNLHGEVTGAINCFYDVTERKRSETLLACQKQALEMVAMGAPLLEVLDYLAREIESQSRDRALVAIHLLDESGLFFQKTIAPSLPPGYAAAANGMLVSSAAGSCCAAVAERRRVVVPDIAASKEWPAFSAVALPLGLRAACSTPIFAASGAVLGTFVSYYREVHEPEPHEDVLGEIVTRTAAVVMESNIAELKLRQSEARYRNLFDSMDEGFCIIKLIFDDDDRPVDFRYIEVNPAFEKQSGLHAAAGRRILELAPDIDEFWLQTYGQVARTGEPIRIINEAKALDRWFDVYAFRIGEEDDRKVAVIFSNITERKQFEVDLGNARDAAEKASLAKSDFLSSMSHELRTPLSAILGFAQLMESGSPPLAPTQKRNIDQILRAGWHLLNLINEILDLALIESGKLSLSLEPISLNDVIAECRMMVEPQAQGRGVSITFPEFKHPYPVLADWTRLKQILINLLSNAIKYNRTGGTVVLACHAINPGRIRICVQDSGEGMGEDKVKQLFQPFNRLGQESGYVEGTGIGLVVCKQLIELMGGAIGVESTLGQGTVFWIDLDVTADRQRVVEAAPVKTVLPPKIQAGARLRTVLYVEDNPANLLLVTELIARRPDLQLLSALDGVRGVEIAINARPDVILMDINLPGISGITALGMLAGNPATGHIPVVALSANAMAHDIQRGLDAGFFRYLTKPIKVNEFMAMLDEALEFAHDNPSCTDGQVEP